MILLQACSKQESACMQHKRHNHHLVQAKPATVKKTPTHRSRQYSLTPTGTDRSLCRARLYSPWWWLQRFNVRDLLFYHHFYRVPECWESIIYCTLEQLSRRASRLANIQELVHTNWLLSEIRVRCLNYREKNVRQWCLCYYNRSLLCKFWTYWKTLDF